MASSGRRPPLCGTSNEARFWLNTQCCGLFCAGITYALITYAMTAMHTAVLPPSRSDWDFRHLVLFDILAVLAMVSHFRAMTTDPGAVPKGAQPPFDGTEDDEEMFPDGGRARRRRQNLRNRRCKRCDSFKPIRAHHCSICKRCVVKMDHHCPWVNNCVGLVNHKFFLLFLMYVFLISCYALVLIFRRHYFICYGAGHSFHDDDDDHRRPYPGHRGQGTAGSDGFGPNESRRLYHSNHKAHLRHRHHSHGHHRRLFAALVGGGAHGEQNDVASAMAVEPYPGRCDLSAGSFMMTLMLFIEAILFGLFTSCMMCDQSSVVTTNLTKIDRLKRKAEEGDSNGGDGGDGAGGGKGSGKGARKGTGEGGEGGNDGDDEHPGGHEALPEEAPVVVNEIFGGEGGRGFRVHWLLPVLPSLPNSVRDEVFGFTRAADASSTRGNGGAVDALGTADAIHGGSTSSGMGSGVGGIHGSSGSSSSGGGGGGAVGGDPATVTNNPPQHLSRDFNIRNVHI